VQPPHDTHPRSSTCEQHSPDRSIARPVAAHAGVWVAVHAHGRGCIGRRCAGTTRTSAPPAPAPVTVPVDVPVTRGTIDLSGIRPNIRPQLDPNAAAAQGAPAQGAGAPMPPGQPPGPGSAGMPPQRPLPRQARAHAPWQSGPKQTPRPRPKRAAPLNQLRRRPQSARHQPTLRRHLHPWCLLRHPLLHRQQRATRPTHTRHRPSPPRLTHPWSPHPQRLRWRQRLWQHHPPNHLRLPRPNSHPVLQRHLPNPRTLRPARPGARTWVPNRPGGQPGRRKTAETGRAPVGGNGRGQRKTTQGSGQAARQDSPQTRHGRTPQREDRRSAVNATDLKIPKSGLRHTPVRS
jgi:hypothetical protein